MRDGPTMKASICLCLFAPGPIGVFAQASKFDPGGVLNQFAVARFRGFSCQTIQARISDSTGNLYVADTTTSLDLPVKNPAQAEYRRHL